MWCPLLVSATDKPPRTNCVCVYKLTSVISHYMVVNYRSLSVFYAAKTINITVLCVGSGSRRTTFSLSSIKEKTSRLKQTRMTSLIVTTHFEKAYIIYFTVQVT